MLRSDGNEFDEVFIFFHGPLAVRRGVLSERGRTDERTVKKMRKLCRTHFHQKKHEKSELRTEPE